MVDGLSQYDTGIAFKLHKFVQMTFYHQCDQFCKYVHLFESICKAWYIEHGIIFLKKMSFCFMV
jgi:hypothetical protein